MGRDHHGNRAFHIRIVNVVGPFSHTRWSVLDFLINHFYVQVFRMSQQTDRSPMVKGHANSQSLTERAEQDFSASLTLDVIMLKFMTMACLVTAIMLVSVTARAQSAHFNITSDDLTHLEDTIVHANVVFALVSDANMPKTEPIAHYVPANTSDANKPTIWIGASHSKILDVTYAPTEEEHRALFTALIIMGMDISPPLSKWRALYDDLQHAGNTQAAGMLVSQLDGDGFRFHPTAFPSIQDDATRELVIAVTGQLTPGVTGVATELRPASALPPYDLLAHYVGWNVNPKYPDQGYVIVNADYEASHGNSVTNDPQLLQEYLVAVVLATCDGGRAGTTWKKRYDAAAAADSAQPESVADRYQNRRALALPIALLLKKTMLFR
jgi:hypothetical protein